ncbi:hypothetical protein ACP3VS_22930 [Lysinibacillus sp. VIII_CA]|uniref:hypothetical protein n=1 Tax=Lysinibacillus TaxID=400634 RepID=UPI0018CDCA21|nr:hypothetical protein [Lysinibacillus sphaericus]MBG9692517.1 hypothetical protein [Lysinibacillus sphaericus]
MNFFEYIKNHSYGEIKELKKEIVSLLVLDRQKINKNESSLFINSRNSIVVAHIDEVLERLEQQEDIDSLIAGVLQLIKVNAIMVSHLQSASFYEEWISKGYIAQIERSIKLPQT